MTSPLEIGRLYDHIGALANPQQTGEVISVPQSEPIVEQVPQSEIVATVMGIVSQAKEEVKMTMHLSEEKDTPLNQDYHDLIKRKVAEGIKITRIGFGSQEDFTFMEEKLGIQGASYVFKRHPNVANYQRFIMVDGEFLFFKFEDSYYRTQDVSAIQQLQAYFDRIVSQT